MNMTKQITPYSEPPNMVLSEIQRQPRSLRNRVVWGQENQPLPV